MSLASHGHSRWTNKKDNMKKASSRITQLFSTTFCKSWHMLFQIGESDQKPHDEGSHFYLLSIAAANWQTREDSHSNSTCGYRRLQLWLWNVWEGLLIFWLWILCIFMSRSNHDLCTNYQVDTLMEPTLYWQMKVVAKAEVLLTVHQSSTQKVMESPGLLFKNQNNEWQSWLNIC